MVAARDATASAAAEMIGAMASLVSAHKAAAQVLPQHQVWRLSDTDFLVGLLTAVCSSGSSDGASCGGHAKRACFAILRSNETDAATYLQAWWRHRRATVAAAAARAARTMPSQRSTAATPQPLPCEERAEAEEANSHLGGGNLAAAPESGVGGVGNACEQPAALQDTSTNLEPVEGSAPSPAAAAAPPQLTLAVAVHPSQPLEPAPVARTPRTPRRPPPLAGQLDGSRPPSAVRALAAVAAASASSVSAVAAVVSTPRPRSRGSSVGALCSGGATPTGSASGVGTPTGGSSGGVGVSTPPSPASAVNSSGAAAASAAASGTGNEDGRYRGVRGENPYRRKWNPRIAAAQRREQEVAAAAKQRELQQVDRPPTAGAGGVAETESPLEEVGPPSDDPVISERGLARAGFSLGAPTDRGPEHRPGSRDRGPTESLFVPADRTPPPAGSGLPEPRGPRPAARRPIATGPEAASPLSTAPAAAGGSTTAEQPMDFSELQRLISRGLASADAGEEFDAEADSVTASAGAFAEKVMRSSSNGGAMAAEPLLPAEPAPPPRGANGRRSMAEIRAAAERRAYQGGAAAACGDASGSSSIGGCGGLPPPIAAATAGDPAAAAAPSTGGGGGGGGVGSGDTLTLPQRPSGSMAEIRAIAERRAQGCRRPPPPQAPQGERGTSGGSGGGEATPRSITPRSSSAYRPTHVYSGRGGGGGLSESLGLRFGVPPPMAAATAAAQ